MGIANIKAIEQGYLFRRSTRCCSKAMPEIECMDGRMQIFEETLTTMHGIFNHLRWYMLWVPHGNDRVKATIPVSCFRVEDKLADHCFGFQPNGFDSRRRRQNDYSAVKMVVKTSVRASPQRPDSKLQTLREDAPETLLFFKVWHYSNQTSLLQFENGHRAPNIPSTDLLR